MSLFSLCPFSIGHCTVHPTFVYVQPFVYFTSFLFEMTLKLTYLKKSSLQYTISPLEKHLSLSCSLQSEHFKHLECHDRSNTFNIKRSKIGSPHPAHLGIAAEEKRRNKQL